MVYQARAMNVDCERLCCLVERLPNHLRRSSHSSRDRPFGSRMDAPSKSQFVRKQNRLMFRWIALLTLCYVESLVIGLSLRRNFSRQSSRPPRPGKYVDDSTTSSSSSSSSKSSNNRGAAEKKIEFVNFWGAKLASDDERTPSDSSKVPCAPSLDLLDGPLPPGAYVEEGNPEYDAKATCRISVAVQWGKSNNDRRSLGQQAPQKTCDPNEIVRRLQSCVDAGFNTFQLYDQQSQGIEIAGRMRQETPSYVETHWSVTMKVPTISNSMLESRETVLRLLEQTKGDALDTLQLEYNPQSPYTLDTLDHLADLQREGFIRSIGVRNMPSSVIQKAISTAGFDSIINFQQQSGNLLLPPRKEFCYPEVNVWMSNPLASGLLTDIHMARQTGGRSRHGRPAPLLSHSARLTLQEWATLRTSFDKDEAPSSYTFGDAWGLYQEQVVQQLQWIALKHQVSVSAVALRWALECGTSSVYNRKKRDGSRGNRQPKGVPAVSSAVVDCAFDSEVFEPHNLRQVFRFELDEEDKGLLKECPTTIVEKSSLQSNEMGKQLSEWEEELRIHQAELAEEQEGRDHNHPKIDFGNRALWL